MGRPPAVPRGEWVSSVSAHGIKKIWIDRAKQWLSAQGDTRNIRDLSRSDLCNLVDHIREKFASDPKNWPSLFGPKSQGTPVDGPFEAGRRRYLHSLSLREGIDQAVRQAWSDVVQYFNEELARVKKAGAELPAPIKILKQQKESLVESPRETKPVPSIPAHSSTPQARKRQTAKRTGAFITVNKGREAPAMKVKENSVMTYPDYQEALKKGTLSVAELQNKEAHISRRLQRGERIAIDGLARTWELHSTEFLKLYAEKIRPYNLGSYSDNLINWRPLNLSFVEHRTPEYRPNKHSGVIVLDADIRYTFHFLARENASLRKLSMHAWERYSEDRLHDHRGSRNDFHNPARRGSRVRITFLGPELLKIEIYIIMCEYVGEWVTGYATPCLEKEEEKEEEEEEEEGNDAFADVLQEHQKIMRKAKHMEEKARSNLAGVVFPSIEGDWDLYSPDVLNMKRKTSSSEDDLLDGSIPIGELQISVNDVNCECIMWGIEEDLTYPFFEMPTAVLEQCSVRLMHQENFSEGTIVFLGSGYLYLRMEVGGDRVKLVGVQSGRGGYVTGDSDYERPDPESDDSDDSSDWSNSVTFEDSNEVEHETRGTPPRGPVPSVQSKSTAQVGNHVKLPVPTKDSTFSTSRHEDDFNDSGIEEDLVHKLSLASLDSTDDDFNIKQEEEEFDSGMWLRDGDIYYDNDEDDTAENRLVHNILRRYIDNRDKDVDEIDDIRWSKNDEDELDWYDDYYEVWR
ncbi:hypothetical protein BDV96DRAFT_684878 [Lophiotrema nucula]|uniref:Uncharacterized protein n=1 Tax=Lophiotrema nucula TaxID=690887 RepID=A0A6A5ZHE9_9PLEO|nr:hypothetical protein BDV96DRAFT_684878 [Lophiotrema nucula]